MTIDEICSEIDDLKEEHIPEVISVFNDLRISVIEGEVDDDLGDQDHPAVETDEADLIQGGDDDTLLEAYMEQAVTDRLLTREEEQILFQNIERGDQDARNLMVRHNVRLVISIAKQYMGRGVSFEDLVQEGQLGLLKAIERFDWRKGFKFSTYATWWIRQAVARAASEQGRPLRIPVHAVDLINRVMRTRNELAQETGVEPTSEEIGEEMGLAKEKVEECLLIAQHTVELDQPIGDGKDSLIDLTPHQGHESPAEISNRHRLSQVLNEIIDTLDEREAMVIRMRYGLLEDGKIYTLDEVGEVLGVTRERVRQIEGRAMRRLRHPSRSLKLMDYLGND